MKTIIFTGGGSGGHVIPAITLIKYLREHSPDVSIQYVGGKSGIEKELISELNISYRGILTGKLRRYFSIQNFTDFFKFFFGVVESVIFLLKFSRKETVIFSTGGFVSLPVVIAGRLTGKRVVVHEQTSRLGPLQLQLF